MIQDMAKTRWTEVPAAQGRRGDKWKLPPPLGMVPWLEGDGQWYQAPLMRRVGGAP